MASYGANPAQGNPNPNNPYDFNGVQVSEIHIKEQEKRPSLRLLEWIVDFLSYLF